MNSASSQIPIIFIHDADNVPRYLLSALTLAKLTNPDSPVFFINNVIEFPKDTNQILSSVARIQMQDYNQEAKDFGERFFNLSVNAASVELACFQRWFTLREFMRRHNIERCFCCDSDVLIFGDVTQASLPFQGVDFTISSRFAWSVTYLNTPRVLDTFCQMATEIYSRTGKLWEQVLDDLNLLNPNGRVGNLSDMTVQALIAQQTNHTYLNTSEITNGSVFDPNINCDMPGFEMEHDQKKIHWVEGAPHGLHLPSNQLIRFNSLHFQGGNKARIFSFFNMYLSKRAQRDKEFMGAFFAV